MKNVLLTVLVVCFALFRPSAGFSEEAKFVVASPEIPKIQIAILLDTSNSMDGLIAQAKAQLWEIVNDFIKVKQNGVTPTLEVALYQYGNTNLKREDYWIERLTHLTTDLDLVSEKLFSLKTRGGEEYCGAVIRQAVKELEWSERRDDLRLIFIAGNEPFTQGPISYVDACKEAVAKHIIVNTIHCGPEQEGIRTKWEDGALMTDGKYLFINQNQRVVNIPAPQDKRLAELNSELNKTYIPYGREGRVASFNQSAQDLNNSNLNAQAFNSRVATKASSNYRNSNWDLVDASAEKGFDLSKVETKTLPENMQKMTDAERKAYVESQAEKRKEIQKEIAQLSAERSKFIAEEQSKTGKKDESLSAKALPAMRKQAIDAKFKY